jgi:long-subunit acyl-CoA synthetase (AMP-forming)
VRLKGFEFPRALHLEPHAFSIDHDLITPKMSLKRPQLLKYYKKQVGMHMLLHKCGPDCLSLDYMRLPRPESAVY